MPGASIRLALRFGAIADWLELEHGERAPAVNDLFVAT